MASINQARQKRDGVGTNTVPSISSQSGPAYASSEYHYPKNSYQRPLLQNYHEIKKSASWLKGENFVKDDEIVSEMFMRYLVNFARTG